MDDLISRQAVLDEAFEVDTKEYGRIEVVGVDAINSLPSVKPQRGNIPFLMHEEMDIPISDCQKAYDVAIDYLRSQGKLKG